MLIPFLLSVQADKCDSLRDNGCQTESVAQQIGQDLLVVVTRDGPQDNFVHAQPPFYPAGQLKHRAMARPKSAPTPRGPRKPSKLRPCGCPKPVMGLAEQHRTARREAAAMQKELEDQEKEDCTVIVSDQHSAIRPSSMEDCDQHGTLTVVVDNFQSDPHQRRTVQIISSPRHNQAPPSGHINADKQHAVRCAIRQDVECGPAKAKDQLLSPPSCQHCSPKVRRLKQTSPTENTEVSHNSADSQHSNSVLSEKPTIVKFSIPSAAKYSIETKINDSTELGGEGRPLTAGKQATAETSTPGTSPVKASKHTSDLITLTNEIQRREICFKGMLGELERITAKCATLASNIAGPAGALHSLRGAQGRNDDKVNKSCLPEHHTCEITHECIDKMRQARGHQSDTVEDAIPAQPITRCSNSPRNERGPADEQTAEQKSTADNNADEWSWEALLRFEKTIKEQHQKVCKTCIQILLLCNKCDEWAHTWQGVSEHSVI